MIYWNLDVSIENSIMDELYLVGSKLKDIVRVRLVHHWSDEIFIYLDDNIS